MQRDCTVNSGDRRFLCGKGSTVGTLSDSSVKKKVDESHYLDLPLSPASPP